MHTFDPNIYPNILPQIHLTSEVIRNTISTYKLFFPKIKSQEVEWFIRLPMFVDSFYTSILEKQTILNQQESFLYYLNFNNTFFEKLGRQDLYEGIKARFYRAYPSLVRDLFFNKYIQERIGHKCQIIYNTQLDIEEGIDLMIVTSKGIYGICFFTNTTRAYTGRKAKEYRHIPFSNVKYIEIPLDFQGSVIAGDFFLYGEKEFNKLYNILSNNYG